MTPTDDTGREDHRPSHEISATTAQDLVKALVDKILTVGLEGAGPIKGAEQVAAEHLATHGDVEAAIDCLIKTHTRLVAATGFASGVGGIAVMAATIPADISALYVAAGRCAGAIAVLRGYDVHSEEVRSVVMLTLIGSAGAGIASEAGAQLGTKAAFSALQRLPGRVLIEINKKVGFRLATKFGTKGVVNLSKAVPLVGGGVSAGINAVTLRSVGEYAKRNFPALVVAGA